MSQKRIASFLSGLAVLLISFSSAAECKFNNQQQQHECLKIEQAQQRAWQEQQQRQQQAARQAETQRQQQQAEAQRRQQAEAQQRTWQEQQQRQQQAARQAETQRQQQQAEAQRRQQAEAQQRAWQEQQQRQQQATRQAEAQRQQEQQRQQLAAQIADAQRRQHVAQQAAQQADAQRQQQQAEAQHHQQAARQADAQRQQEQQRQQLAAQIAEAQRRQQAEAQQRTQQEQQQHQQQAARQADVQRRLQAAQQGQSIGANPQPVASVVNTSSTGKTVQPTKPLTYTDVLTPQEIAWRNSLPSGDATRTLPPATIDRLKRERKWNTYVVGTNNVVLSIAQDKKEQARYEQRAEKILQTAKAAGEVAEVGLTVTGVGELALTGAKVAAKAIAKKAETKAVETIAARQVDVVKSSAEIATGSGSHQAGVIFRGDTRAIDAITSKGFQTRGTNADLYRYVSQGVPSNFVSATKSLGVAKSFATKQGSGYVYKIHRQPNGLDVNTILGKKSPFPYETEIAVPGGIKSSDVMGAWQVAKNGKYGPFIRNPAYTPK